MPSWWETLELSLRDPKTGNMALFGDDQQQVFGERPAPEGNFAILRLVENLRNSQQIAKAVASLISRPSISKGPHSFEIEYVKVESESQVFDAADDQIAKLVDEENWGPKEIALLTTCHRHPEHVSRAEKDRADHWRSLWEDDDVFYCTVGGFKGLERPVVVLAIDGFHEDIDPNDVLYVGMSRARDKLVVVGTSVEIARIKSLVS
jgi:superfamily I DNA/RNA helicase